MLAEGRAGMKLSVRYFRWMCGGYAALWLVAQPVCAYLSLVLKVIDQSLFYRIFLPASILQIGCGLLYAVGFARRIDARWFLIFAALLSWMGGVVLAHFLFESPLYDASGVSFDYFNTRVIVYSLAQFSCVLVLAGGTLSRIVPFALWGCVLAFVAAFSVAGEMDYGRLTQVEASAIYLMLGDSFAIVGLLCLGSLSGSTLRAVVAVLSVACLWFIQSRTSLYLFVVVLAFQLVLGIHRGWLRVIAIAVIAVVGAALVTPTADVSGRMTIIGNLQGDSSFNSRMIQVQVGLGHILANPLAGAYEGVYREFGGFGQYIHGLPSYWQVFGLMPFLMAVAIVAAAGRRLLRAQLPPEWRMVVAYSIACALISRAYLFPFVPILAGVLAAWRASWGEYADSSLRAVDAK